MSVYSFHVPILINTFSAHNSQHGAVIRKQKRSPESLLNRMTTWYMPANEDPVSNEVSMAISDMVHHVARGTVPGPAPARPPLLHHEVEVCVRKGVSPLLMNIGETQGRLYVMDFRKKEDGSAGPAEATGRIKRGDILVAVNGVYMHEQGFRFMVKQLTSKAFAFLYLRFIRLPVNEKTHIESILSECVNPPLGRRPVPLRSRYFGVYPSLEHAGRWTAEAHSEYKAVELGVFDSELAAAHAYDTYVVKQHGRDWCRLNFQPIPAPAPASDGDGDAEDVDESDVEFSEELSSGAAILGRVVDEEIAHNIELAKEISDMESLVARSKNKEIDAAAAAAATAASGKSTSPTAMDMDSNGAAEANGVSDARAGGGDKEGQGGSDDDLVSEGGFRGQWESDDSDDSDSNSDAAGGSSDEDSGDDDDNDADKNSSDSSDDDNDWEESNNKKKKEDKEWRPKAEMEAAGPIGRLLRAVNESDNRPYREEWENYMVELGMIAPELRDDGRPKRIEQIDLATNTTLKVWDTITAAGRVLNIPVYTIGACTRGRVDTAGGFKWKVIYATDQEIAEGAAADEVCVNVTKYI
jgi:hypothetical protein